jgi:hypothetical protein
MAGAPCGYETWCVWAGHLEGQPHESRRNGLSAATSSTRAHRAPVTTFALGGEGVLRTYGQAKEAAVSTRACQLLRHGAGLRRQHGLLRRGAGRASPRANKLAGDIADLPLLKVG